MQRVWTCRPQRSNWQTSRSRRAEVLLWVTLTTFYCEKGDCCVILISTNGTFHTCLMPYTRREPNEMSTTSRNLWEVYPCAVFQLHDNSPSSPTIYKPDRHLQQCETSCAKMCGSPLRRILIQTCRKFRFPESTYNSSSHIPRILLTQKPTPQRRQREQRKRPPAQPYAHRFPPQPVLTSQPTKTRRMDSS